MLEVLSYLKKLEARIASEVGKVPPIQYWYEPKDKKWYFYCDLGKHQVFIGGTEEELKLNVW